jgi:hypothetical protein
MSDQPHVPHVPGKSPLPESYRFRLDWRDHLVLQRAYQETGFSIYAGRWSVTRWRDATVEDLVHFFTNQES